MNVEIGTEAALFPEKEYMSGIFVAVHSYHHAKIRNGYLEAREEKKR